MLATALRPWRFRSRYCTILGRIERMRSNELMHISYLTLEMLSRRIVVFWFSTLRLLVGVGLSFQFPDGQTDVGFLSGKFENSATDMRNGVRIC